MLISKSLKRTKVINIDESSIKWEKDKWIKGVMINDQGKLLHRIVEIYLSEINLRSMKRIE